MVTKDTTWTIDGIEAAGLVGETPTLTRGTEISLTFEFRGVVQREEEYPALLQYLDVAGDEVVRRGTSDRGVPWIRERLPDDAPVESLVVPIRAGLDVIDTAGLWGVIIGGDDVSRPPSDRRRVELSVFVLDEFEAFDSRAEVLDAYGDQL